MRIEEFDIKNNSMPGDVVYEPDPLIKITQIAKTTITKINQTKCTKMSDESNTSSSVSIIKNGINGAPISNLQNSNDIVAVTNAIAAAAIYTRVNTSTINSPVSVTDTSNIRDNEDKVKNLRQGVTSVQDGNNINNNGIESTSINFTKDDIIRRGADILREDNHQIHRSQHQQHDHSKRTTKSVENDVVGGSNVVHNGSEIRSQQHHHHHHHHHHHQQQQQNHHQQHQHHSQNHHHHHPPLPPPHNQQHQQNQNYQGMGGRLQFFKDGKFILELARSREGEKCGWVSVPRKTYWPPSASVSTTNTPSTNFTKNDSSASLSFSDDNSSIQSSPWQRDHSWKQSNPRKNISKEMCMIYKRQKNFIFSQDGYKIAKIKRRRPYDTHFCKMPLQIIENGNITNSQIKSEIKLENSNDDKGDNKVIADNIRDNIDMSNNTNCDDNIDSIDGKTEIKQEKNDIELDNNNDKSKNYQEFDIQSIEIDCQTKKTVANETAAINTTVDSASNVLDKKKCNNRTLKVNKLTTILQKLIDRLPAGGFSSLNKQATATSTTGNGSTAINHHFPSTTARIVDLHHQHHQHVSPRKRILRELEKVTLEDNKRSRAKTSSGSVITTLSPLITSSPTTVTSMCHNVQKSSNVSAQNLSSSSFSHSSQGDSVNEQHQIKRTSSPASQTTTNSTRLYSSYSIHSLLGNTNSNTNNNNANHIKNESKNHTNVNNYPHHSMKETNDPSYLRNVLASPKSPENVDHSPQTHLSAISSLVLNNRKKLSPTYNSGSSLQQDIHHTSHHHYSHHHQQQQQLSRSPSSSSADTLISYARVRSPELNQSPDHSMNSRYKQFGSANVSTSSGGGFHPYLTSPKYSSSSSSPNPPSDNYKYKSIHHNSSSPNHHGSIRNAGTSSRSPSSTSSTTSAFCPSSQNNYNKMTSFHSPTPNNSNRLREPSPSGAVSPSLERREAIPRTVPKKTVSLRQQFSSVSSPSVTQGDILQLSSSTPSSSVSSFTCKTSLIGASDYHQKRKNHDERTLSPENPNTMQYHSGADMEHVTAGVLRSSPALPHSPLFYLYPSSSAAAAASSYIPPVPYYHPYAAAVAALRNPLWMHYQAASAAGMQSRFSASSIFPYNGGAATVVAAASSGIPTSSPSLPSSLATMHPAAAAAAAAAWSSFNRENSSTEDPVSLVSIKDEHSSDVPLNLSKH